MSDVVHLLIAFVPFALAAGFCEWKTELVFSFGLLSLIGLDAVISSSLDRICLSFDGKVPKSYFADLISIVTPTTVSLRAKHDVDVAFYLGFVLQTCSHINSNKGS